MSVVLLAAVALLAPPLTHGASIGPFDLLSQDGLTTKNGVVVHKNSSLGDLSIIGWRVVITVSIPKETWFFGSPHVSVGDHAA